MSWRRFNKVSSQRFASVLIGTILLIIAAYEVSVNLFWLTKSNRITKTSLPLYAIGQLLIVGGMIRRKGKKERSV